MIFYYTDIIYNTRGVEKIDIWFIKIVFEFSMFEILGTPKMMAKDF